MVRRRDKTLERIRGYLLQRLESMVEVCRLEIRVQRIRRGVGQLETNGTEAEEMAVD